MPRAIGIDSELGIVAEARKSGVEVVLRSENNDPASLAKEAGVPLKSAALAVGGPQVFLRVLDLPGDLDRQAVAEAVKWQVAEVMSDRLTRHAVTGKIGDQWCVLVGSVPSEVGRQKAAVLDLRVAALWRGVLHFLGELDAPVAVIEVSPSGGRVVAGKDFLAFAREIGGDQEAELQRTLLYCRSRLGEGLRVFRVGEDLPEETVAVGLALRNTEPRFNFLVKERPSLTGIAVSGRTVRLLAAAFVLALLPHAAAFAYKMQAAEYTKKADLLAPQAQRCAALRAERQKYEDWIAIVRAFSTSPAWPLMEDLRQAVPASCWLTSAVAEPAPKTAQGVPQPAPQGNQQAQPTNTNQPPQQSGQPATPASQNGQNASLPDRAGKLTLEGYSKDAASVGLFKDNLEALPWCGGVSSLSLKWDDKVGAFSFKLTAAVKQPQAGPSKGG